MTPTETTALLRQFNAWRRDLDNKVEQPDSREIGEAIDAAIAMIDRLEAAESDGLEQARLNGMGASREAALMAKLEAAEKERDWNAERLEDAIEECAALRAKIEAMERQSPSHWGCNVLQSDARWKEEVSREAPPEGYFSVRDAFPLYLAPGAQPAPSIPEGWLRAIDEALVVAHIGVANADDTYEQAKAKLDNLIGFHIDVTTDPAVNGGWKLVPIKPTIEMLRAGHSEWIESAGADPCFNVYRAMLVAAPEAKP